MEERKAKGVVVPLLEELLERGVSVDDDEDRAFMLYLMNARARQREKGVFSPSMLSSCLRQSYYAKTGKERFPVATPRSNAIFIDGDFRHYKWQFCLWKLHRAEKLHLIGCEVRVFHASGDFAGTIDAIVVIDGETFIIDFKGMNVSSFQSFVRWGTSEGYKLQIVGYGLILNTVKSPIKSEFFPDASVRVDRVILIGENKGGPDNNGSPIALHEDIIEIRSYKSKVKRRMALLRRYVADEEVPEPSCKSTRYVSFLECPFSPHCRDEVRAIQRQDEKLRRENATKRKVRTPSATGTPSPRGDAE